MNAITNPIYASFQVLLIATTLCSVFLSFTGFFNELLTSKLFGLGMVCLLVFAIATGFFPVATVFNMNVLQGKSAGDVSLEGIAVMAKA
ncbi:hypothetical protein [Alkalitalea saponilacus]|uniref:Uncharacterized protein n=1 Tax=Alkalitalea saponilacus TaxID=889453 RepID=A0A1T5HN31_9BACT|nr:hypothetical protein [Alkalitalea saponilacus]ASB49384.1 hypothetical protein CDL62_09645 [Alkalitalea saponilacus]SKC21941.1 hypothetical protein SAMN03080601_02478 [Alkalitalea saponilacus]